MAVEEIIKEINEKLTSHIIENCRGKKVLLDVSGGHDTRVNLSILLNQGIEFDVFTRKLSRGDVEISQKICKKYNLNQRIFYKRHTIREEDKLLCEYDVHLKGTGYSEYMCMLHKLNKSLNKINSINEYRKTKPRHHKTYIPAFEAVR